jgi:3-oxoacyl-[acyl-carrier protein] reductase
MELGLADKVALVTGGSSGIGRAVAAALVAEGCSVALVARGADALDAAAASLFPRASTHPADVTMPAACRLVAQAARDRWGRLDVVICAVGSGASVPPGEETPEEWQRVLAVNLHAAPNVVAACRPHLGAGAAIVCVSSICGVETVGAPVAYEAGKAALNAYVRGMARPLAAAGIRLNAVAPGNVLVPGGRWDQRQRRDPAGITAMLDRDVALRRFARPQEIADIAVFLASPRAAFVTGAVWIADGGQTRS